MSQVIPTVAVEGFDPNQLSHRGVFGHKRISACIGGEQGGRPQRVEINRKIKRPPNVDIALGIDRQCIALISIRRANAKPPQKGPGRTEFLQKNIPVPS